MLVVRVELWSALTGAKTEIARAVIFNDGSGSRTFGNYDFRSFRGRDSDSLDRSMRNGSAAVVRTAKVTNHPRLREHVWSLVAKALNAAGYAKGASEDLWTESPEETES